MKRKPVLLLLLSLGGVCSSIAGECVSVKVIDKIFFSLAIFVGTLLSCIYIEELSINRINKRRKEG